jgi:hypothetical protein
MNHFSQFGGVIGQIGQLHRSGKWGPRHSEGLRRMLGPAFSTDTMQGFVYHKPHGYAGDYEKTNMTDRHPITFRPIRPRLERVARKLGLLVSADDRDSDLVVFIRHKSGHHRLLTVA